MNTKKNNTSWNKVAKWYYKHLLNDKGNYHVSLIAPKLQKTIKRLIPNKSSTIVDMACGQGLIANEFAKLGYQVAGIDIAPQLIELARKQYENIDFAVGDASTLTPNLVAKHANTSLILCNLAIQNIENLTGFCNSAKSILRKDGYAVIVINHPMFRIPKQTAWEFDEQQKIMYRRVDKYKTPIQIPILMSPGKQAQGSRSEVTISFHRPLEMYVKAFAQAGMQLIDLEEWVSNKLSEPGPRAKAENIARNEIPLFMLLVFKKI